MSGMCGPAHPNGVRKIELSQGETWWRQILPHLSQVVKSFSCFSYRFDRFVRWIRKQTWEQGELEDTDFLKDSEEKGVSLDVKNSDTTVIELKLI